MFKAIEDATAYWLYPDDGSYEEWQLDGEPTVSPDGHSARLRFRLEDDRFELVVQSRDGRTLVKHADRDDPSEAIPALLLRADDECVVLFRDADHTVFVHLVQGR